MRLIDSEMIKIPTSLIHNINGCFMIRVEDVQRITSDQPTAFDKEKVIEQIKVLSTGIILNTNISDDYAEGYVRAVKDIIEIVEKGGIE